MAPSPSVHPSPGLEQQRDPGGPAGLPSSPAALQHTPLRPVPQGARSGKGGGAQGVRAQSAKGSYLSASIRPTELGLLLGLRRWGSSHGLELRLPEPPGPSVAPSGTPGPGARRRADGRKRLLWGGRVCRVPPGGELGAIILKNKGGQGRLRGPPSRGMALNLNLYLTLCPEGGEGTRPSWDGVQPSTASCREEARPPFSARVGSRASPGAPGAPQTVLGSRVLGSPRLS